MLFEAKFCCVNLALTVSTRFIHKNPFVVPFGKESIVSYKNIQTGVSYHLSAISFDVRIEKIMLFVAILCCVDTALIVAACLSHKSSLVAHFGKKVRLI